MSLYDIANKIMKYIIFGNNEIDLIAECEDSIQFDKDIYRDFILKNPTVNIYPY